MAGMLGLVAGCAGVSQAPDAGAAAKPEQIVGQRAQQRWDALIAGDIEKAYGYLSPGSRQVTSLVAYGRSVSTGFWKKVRVVRVECPEADLCHVGLSVEYVHKGTVVTTPSRESWTRIDGQWWFVLR